jgi:hypothetical protein
MGWRTLPDSLPASKLLDGLAGNRRPRRVLKFFSIYFSVFKSPVAPLLPHDGHALARFGTVHAGCRWRSAGDATGGFLGEKSIASTGSASVEIECPIDPRMNSLRGIA